LPRSRSLFYMQNTCSDLVDSRTPGGGKWPLRVGGVFLSPNDVSRGAPSDFSMTPMRTLAVVAAVFVLVAFAPALPPPAPASSPREITADVARVSGSHSRAALMVVGAGRANEGLRADWQAQLALTQREIGFRYIRFHGLLDDDMGVYTEDTAGNPRYNFQYVDTLFDALLALHIRPFVELSFMPSKLASGQKTVFWYKANISPPKDMDKWAGLIRALLAHWRQRYGEKEISQWYFEVWNEPDLKLFFDGSFDQYMDLYRVTATTIKAVCPACRVGGPAAAQGPTERRLLTTSRRTTCPPTSFPPTSTRPRAGTSIRRQER